MSEHQPHATWQKTEDNRVTVDIVNNVLAAVDNDLWVVAACTDKLVDDVDVQGSLLELGIRRSTSAVERAKGALLGRSELHGASVPAVTLAAYFADVPEDAQLCHMRAVLLDRLDRLSSFVHIYKDVQKEDDIDDEWEDDPWANDTAGVSSVRSIVPSGDSLIPLSEFLVKDLVDMACLFASQELYPAVRTLMARHSSKLWPFRFVILKSIPSHALPSEYSDLLPAYDFDQHRERIPSPENWRAEHDWVELPMVKTALQGSKVLSDQVYAYLSVDCRFPMEDPLGPLELTAWYKERVDGIISSTGMLDIALATVQHGASLDVLELDKLGEDLSLLTRLVYDGPQPDGLLDVEDWSLSRWKAMEPRQVVNAYLAHSTPETVASDISHLVMPYLFVLEAHAERAGEPDSTLATRMLYEYILAAPLPIVAAIFEASKSTLPVSQRIIRDDEDVARLALACLYGSDTYDEWSTMGLIFECLPAWDITDTEDDEADATIVSLGAFVTPTTTRPRCSANDLFLFFKPLPLNSLSRALDILDVHLECGGIFSRWNVPAPLRWFLQSAHDVAEQRAWANRMVRRAHSSPTEMKGRDDWEWLLEDMKKLRTANNAGINRPFGLLSEEEISSIFLSGLLSTGLFDIARSLLLQHPRPLSLSAVAVEDVCLSVSREFYDNASSGNYWSGDMKLAYDCLAVPWPSERLSRERDFIEATSRLSSFNISSRPGVPLSPIEIRLTKDRLSLISRVLSSTTHAYKHTQVILDLLPKLGFKDDIVAEVKTLAMLSDTALQAEEFTRAFGTSQKMIETVLRLRAESPAAGAQDARLRETSQVCWVACYQLGRQPEFHDTEKKLELLGRALEFCPADKLPDVLASWRRLQREDLDNRRERLASRSSTHRTRPATPEKLASSLHARLKDLHMPMTPLINAEDAAALAGRAFNRIALNFPFTVGARGPSGSLTGDERPKSRDGSGLGHDGEDVSAQASRVLQKGIGWLLGADDES